MIPHAKKVNKYHVTRLLAAYNGFELPRHLYIANFLSPLKHNLAYRDTAEISLEKFVYFAPNI